MVEGAPEGANVVIPTIHHDWTAEATSTHARSDLILVSVDSIRFHVHQGRLVAASINSFSGKLPMPLVRADEQGSRPGGSGTPDSRVLRVPVLNLPYIGSVVNILLYVIYDRAGLIRNPSPTLSDLSSTVLALKEYGIPLETSLSETSHLYEVFSAFCQRSPLSVYPTAASHASDMHHIAEHASQFFLSLDLGTITDEMADRMGAAYLRRLFMLHVGRVEEFKKLMIGPIPTHAPTPQCDAGPVRQGWALATAYLTSSAAPDVTSTAVDNVLSPVVGRLSCHRCEASLRERFETLKHRWSLVKVSKFSGLPVRHRSLRIQATI